MRLIRLSFVACLVASSVVALAQEPIPILDVRQNDPMGLPVLLHQVVTIQGVVTAPTDLFSGVKTDVYIQDDTAGVNLYSSNQDVASFNLGDEWRVTGEVIVYRGLTEITPTSAELIGTGRPLPEPVVITCNQLYYSYDSTTNIELNEARLVRLNNVTAEPTSTAGAYILTDPTGSSMLYIVGSTGIPAPEGEFNVVGVVKQFDENMGEDGPYYLGYEVLPRYITDITYGSGAQFTSYPVQTDIAMGGATIAWTTDVACETVLQYGTTTAFELEPIRLGDSATDHEVVLTGLPSATVYHCRAVAGDASLPIYSPAVTIASPAEGSSGEVDVYFSRSVDTTYATGVPAVQTDIAARLIERIGAAAHSIDFCFENLELAPIGDALVAAHNRGVQVRVIFEDDDEVPDPVVDVVRAGGITVKTDPDAAYHNMHNRFAVFDAGGDETDDLVWAGSWNSADSEGRLDADNAVVVQDAALAAAYTIEFEEMWGDNYNSTEDNTPHLFLIGGKRVEQYMGPSDDPRSRTIDAIASAGTDVLFAASSFTDSLYTSELVDRIGAGAAVRGIFDASGAEYEYSQDDPLAAAGADVVLDAIEQGGEDALLRHKYVLADPLTPNSDPILVTGSVNWTGNAAIYNNENTLVFHDATVANVYFQEWMARYHEAGGTWAPAAPPVAAFTHSPDSPVAGQAVAFTDTSTGSPTAWAWSFGDDGTSTEQNPTHTYAAAGTYSVTLTVSNAQGNSTATQELVVGGGPSDLDELYFIAAAGNAAGTGSQWATDVEINNPTANAISYQFLWLPRDTDNTDPTESEVFTLAAGASVRYENVIDDVFGLAAFGALAVAADSSEAIVMSRTYNVSAEGTFGQSIVGLHSSRLTAANERMRIVFMTETETGTPSSGYRANLGFVNGTNAALVVNYALFDSQGTQLDDGTVDLDPWGNTQLNRVFQTFAPVDGYVDVWTETAGGAFVAYGSVVDNATGDPTTIMPATANSGSLEAERDQLYYIGAAGNAAGTGSQWATDVELNNPTANAISYQFLWLPRDTDNSDPTSSDVFTLAAGASVRYENVVDDVFGLAAFGALAVAVDSADTIVMSRTYNVSAEGTFGQSIDGIHASHLTAANERMRIVFMTETEAGSPPVAGYRANLGFLNGTNAALVVSYALYDSTGTMLDDGTVDLDPWGNTQLNRVFQSSAPVDGYVDVWTETTAGAFVAYGSVVDNATGDPTTIMPE